MVAGAVDLEGAQHGGTYPAFGRGPLQEQRPRGLGGAEEAARLERRVLGERPRGAAYSVDDPSRTTVRHRSGSASTSQGLVFTAIVAARSAAVAFARPAARENTTSGSAARTAAVAAPGR